MLIRWGDGVSPVAAYGSTRTEQQAKRAPPAQRATHDATGGDTQCAPGTPENNTNTFELLFKLTHSFSFSIVEL